MEEPKKRTKSKEQGLDRALVQGLFSSVRASVLLFPIRAD